MLDNELFEKVLIEPVREGADKLFVVSGYASPAMAFNHMHRLKDQRLNVEIELIVGLCSRGGLRRSHHLAFKKLVTDDFRGCSNVVTYPQGQPFIQRCTFG